MDLLLKLCLSLILYFGIWISDATAAGCEIDLTQGADFKRPLFLKENKKFLYANYENKGKMAIGVTEGEAIYKCCPGVECELLKCSGNSKFVNSNTKKTIDNINAELCASSLTSVTEKVGRSQLCGHELTTYNIAFGVVFSGKATNLPLYTVCFIEEHKLTAYLSHKIFEEQTIGPSGRWDLAWDYSESVYNFNEDPNEFYTKNTQANAISKQCSDWITIEGNNYFSRGHLIPSADFGPLPQRRLTYNLLNAVPQWQPYNQAQWQHVENSLRALTRNTYYKWEVITGTYETVKCPKTKQNIHLYDPKGHNQNGISIPEVLYKIINKQIVLIISNNPMSASKNPRKFQEFLTLVRDGMCNGHDICERIQNLPEKDELAWVKATGFRCNKDNDAKGYTHACLYSQSIFDHVSRKQKRMLISVKANYRKLMGSLSTLYI